MTRGPLAGTGPSMVTSTGREVGARPRSVARQRHPGEGPGAAPARAAAAAAGPTACARRRGAPVEDGREVGRHVGVGVEAEHGVGLGQLEGELLAVPLGEAPDGDDGLGACPSPLRSEASSSASMESFLAWATKPQVLTTATSASAASSTRSQPSACNRPASSSESTSLRVQPRVTRATLRREGAEVVTRGVYGPPGRTRRSVDRGRIRVLIADSTAARIDLLTAHPLVDGHNDLPWEAREQVGYDFDRLDIAQTARRLHTDLPRLRAGRVVGAVLVGLRADATCPSDEAVTATLEQIDVVHRWCDRYPDGSASRAPPPTSSARVASGPHRQADGRRGRALDRRLAGGAADAARPGRAVHDAHPQRQHRPGPTRPPTRRPRRAQRLRPRGRAGDEPPRHDRRPVPRRQPTRCATRCDAAEAPVDLQPLSARAVVRQPAQRARRRAGRWRHNGGRAWWRSCRSSSARGGARGAESGRRRGPAGITRPTRRLRASRRTRPRPPHARRDHRRRRAPHRARARGGRDRPRRARRRLRRRRHLPHGPRGRHRLSPAARGPRRPRLVRRRPGQARRRQHAARDARGRGRGSRPAGATGARASRPSPGSTGRSARRAACAGPWSGRRPGRDHAR